MATFSIEYAQGTPDIARQPRANLNVDTGGQAIGQAVSGLGGAMFDVGLKIQKAEEVSELSSFEVAATRRMNEHYQSMLNNQDPDSYEKSRQQAVSDIQGFAGGLKNKNAALLAGRYAEDMDVDSQFKTLAHANQTRIKNVAETHNSNEDFWANQAISGTPEEYKSAMKKIGSSYKGMVDTGIFSEDVAKARMQLLAQKVNTNRKVFLNKQAVDSTFTEAISSIGPDWNKDKAYEIIKKSGLPTEDIVTLGNRVDGYVSGQKKTIEDNKYAVELKTTTDFSKALKDRNFSADMIESAFPGNTKEIKAVKEKWYAVLNKSYEPAPFKTTKDGGNLARNVIIDTGKKQIDTKSAYDILLKARYVDKTITDADFDYAVGKIEKPYPEAIAADIESVLISNHKTIAGWWETGTDANKVNEVNSTLLKWIDAEIENGKRPTTKEMLGKSAELMVTGIRTEKVGRIQTQSFKHIITIDGKKYGSDTGGKDLSKWTQIQ